MKVLRKVAVKIATEHDFDTLLAVKAAIEEHFVVECSSIVQSRPSGWHMFVDVVEARR